MRIENAGELSWVGAEQVQTALVCIPCQGNQHPPHLDHVEDVDELGHIMWRMLLNSSMIMWRMLLNSGMIMLRMLLNTVR